MQECGMIEERLGRRILIVDDNPDLHEDYRKILTPGGPATGLAGLESAIFGTEPSGREPERYEVDSAYQGPEALEMVRAAIGEGRPYALAFVDMRMPPGWDGLETIERLWEVDHEMQVVICTAYSDHSRDEIVSRTGGAHRLVILKKPFDIAEVTQLAYAMTAKWRSSRQASMKMSELEGLVARRTEELSATNERLRSKVDELEHTKVALEVSEQRYSLAAAGANDGLWDWDLSTGCVYYSTRCRSILGLPDSDAGDGPDLWLPRVHPNDAAQFRALLDEHLAGQAAHLESEHRVRVADGGYAWVLCRGLAVRSASGGPVRLAGSISDISHRKDAEDQLRRGAYYDRLTGLPNRALLRECLEEALHATEPSAGCRFAVLFLDFDNFKVVNDSLGHLAGDELLVEVGARLSRSIRDAYPAPHVHTIARLGGDEFVVLLKGPGADAEAPVVAKAIQSCFERPFMVQGSEVFSTASIGIAIDHGAYTCPEEVLRDADTAMYNAKAKGPGRHTFFDRSMRDVAIARLTLESELRGAIQSGEIGVAYQPIVDLDSGQPIGLEALARWSHPDRGPVSPDRFIPIAEETGLIIPLGERILQIACRDLKELRSLAPQWRDFRVNVNLSGRQFAQSSLVDTVIDTLHRFSLPPQALALEVTETVIMEDFDAAAATIRRLRALGVEVYMDDFGIGYSSLACLKLLPLTGLKLDRSFLSHFEDASTNPAIIHAIVTLAGHLRMGVVAEGVETPDQLAGVLALECTQAQGYLFGRAVPFGALVEQLTQPKGGRGAA
jgi:diguanylate cyclase (GGDEF)-like protein/PAS domain S-box-containing protein